MKPDREAIIAMAKEADRLAEEKETEAEWVFDFFSLAYAACQKDAERYRWLRNQIRPDDFYSGAPRWEVSYQANGMGQVMRTDKLDAAIDAAMREEVK